MGAATILKVEDRAIQEFAEEGWSTLKSGWPDLLLYRVVNGELQVKFREIKSKHDKLRPKQKELLEILHKLGLDVGVYWIDEKILTPGSTDIQKPIPITKITPEELQAALQRSYKVYQKDEEGRRIVPTPLRRSGCGYNNGGTHKGYKLQYKCPVCSKYRRTDKNICGTCLNKAGIDWLEYYRHQSYYTPELVKTLIEDKSK